MIWQSPPKWNRKAMSGWLSPLRSLTEEHTSQREKNVWIIRLIIRLIDWRWTRRRCHQLQTLGSMFTVNTQKFTWPALLTLSLANLCSAAAWNVVAYKKNGCTLDFRFFTNFRRGQTLLYSIWAALRLCNNYGSAWSFCYDLYTRTRNINGGSTGLPRSTSRWRRYN